MTVYYKRGKEIKPMGWVACTLITHEYSLRQGIKTLGLWPDLAANPTGSSQHSLYNSLECVH